MALFMCRDVIVSGQGYVGVPGTIWGGSRTCSTGDNTSLGHQPITTEMTQATPCCPGLLTSEREERGGRLTDSIRGFEFVVGKLCGVGLHLPACVY